MAPLCSAKFSAEQIQPIQEPARMEANEVNEFANQMKEAGEEGQSVKSISLAISILAVLVAMVTVLGHRSHTEAILAQANASDMWNEYQSKKLDSRLYERTGKLLSLQPNSSNDAVQKQLEDDRKQQEKWKDDLADEKKQAEEFVADRKHAEAQASRYDLGEALLQIGVVLCSITLFTRRRVYFAGGLFLGIAGLIFAASALLVR
jgi:hypothetical protein